MLNLPLLARRRRRSNGAITLTMTGLTSSEARPGDHASISVGFPTGVTAWSAQAWGVGSYGDDTYGTGGSPTDYTASDGLTLLWEGTGDDGKTYRASAPIRYAVGTFAALTNQSFTDDTGDQTYVFDAATGTGLTWTYALVSPPSGVTIVSATRTITFDTNALALQTGTAISVSATDQYGRAATGSPRSFDLDIVESSEDADAAAYLDAVETADGQALEANVRAIVNAFIVWLKANGIWDSINAACFLGGARTLSGALTPLKGPAPTNNNFVSGDYDRVLGLTGDGSTKYINTNYADNVNGQDDQHIAAYVGTAAPGTNNAHIGTSFSSPGCTALYDLNDGRGVAISRNISGFYITGTSGGQKTGLYALSRDNSANFDWQIGATTGTHTNASVAADGENYSVFKRGADGVWSDATLQFYSAGSALSDTTLLADRLATLMTDIGAAIP